MKSKGMESEVKNVNKNDKELKNGEVRTEVLNDGMGIQTKSEEHKKQEKKAEIIRDKSKPVSSTPVLGTPWYVVIGQNVCAVNYIFVS